MTCKIWQIQENSLENICVLPQTHEPVSLTWSPHVGNSINPLLVAIGNLLILHNVLHFKVILYYRYQLWHCECLEVAN